MALFSSCVVLTTGWQRDIRVPGPNDAARGEHRAVSCCLGYRMRYRALLFTRVRRARANAADCRRGPRLHLSGIRQHNLFRLLGHDVRRNKARRPCHFVRHVCAVCGCAPVARPGRVGHRSPSQGTR